MKKAIIVLLICFIFTFCACGKSNDIKSVEYLISKIGDVSYDSADAINIAQSAYDALSDQEKEKVENYQTLIDAKEEFNAIGIVGDNWEFVNLALDCTEIDVDGIEMMGWDYPTLECTNDEFTIDALSNVFTGTWKPKGDNQFSFLVDDEEVLVATLIADNGKQTLTIKDNALIAILSGHSLSMTFERYLK